MGTLQRTWNRIVKVVMMPDDVMGIERAHADQHNTQERGVPVTARYATQPADPYRNVK